MTAKFRHAPEVQAIAEVLIAEHHQHLDGWRIEYLFRDKAPKSSGRLVLGRARVKRGLDAFLARGQLLVVSGDGEISSARMEDERPIDPPPFFVMEISLDTWGEDIDGVRWGLSDEQRVALVDHELCHFQVTEDGEPKLRSHTVEEFADVVKRHGLWKPDVEWFATVTRAARPLPFGNGQSLETGA